MGTHGGEVGSNAIDELRLIIGALTGPERERGRMETCPSAPGKEAESEYDGSPKALMGPSKK